MEGWDPSAENRPLPPWPRIPYQHPRARPGQMKEEGSLSWLCQEVRPEPEQAWWLAALPGREASGCPARANLQPWVQRLLFSRTVALSLLTMASSLAPGVEACGILGLVHAQDVYEKDFKRKQKIPSTYTYIICLVTAATRWVVDPGNCAE